MGDQAQKVSPLSFTDLWEVIKAYSKDDGFTNDSINSFDVFMDRLGDVPTPIVICECENANSSHRNTKHVITFHKARVGKPKLNEEDPNKKTTFLSHPRDRNKSDNATLYGPHESRERSLSYTVPISYDILHEVTKNGVVTRKWTEGVLIGDMPIPVGSKYDIQNSQAFPNQHECPMDKKGFFVVGGYERVVQPQARMRYNHCFVFEKSAPNKKNLYSEIRSQEEGDCSAPSVALVRFNVSRGGRDEETFKVKLPYNKYDISLSVMFRALGVNTDREIFDLITQGSSNKKIQQATVATLEEGQIISTQRDALGYIGRKAQSFTDEVSEERIIEFATNLLNKDLFPHMGRLKENFKEKAIYLGYVCYKILRVFVGLAKVEVRDNCSKKRFELVGPLLETLYGELMDTLGRDVKQLLAKYLKEGRPISDVSILFKKKNMSHMMKYVINTGNWTSRTSKRTNKTGVTAIVQRLSYASTVSHYKRINTPIGREGKLSKPRQLEWSQWGMLCPSETPEGGNVGFVNNLSLVAHVTLGCSSYHLMDIIFRNKLLVLKECTVVHFSSWIRVFVNGKWVGMIEKGLELVQLLRKMKRTLDINQETSVYYNMKERSIYICTDSGRVMRPLLVVEDGKLKITKERLESLSGKNNPRYKDSFTALLAEGVVEMVDVEEEDNLMVAMFVKDLETDQQYTHCEIHPVTIYGELAGSIPFLNHLPSPRITFQSAMGKQAVGVPVLNFNERMDTVQHVLNYPQKPMTFTKVSELAGFDESPSGHEAVVMIAVLDGFNQEDAIIINKGSVDRGFGRSSYYRTYREEEKKYGNHYTEEFKKPDPENCIGMKTGSSYEKLEEDGIIGVGTKVVLNDIIIGKTSPNLNSDNNSKQIYRKMSQLGQQVDKLSTERGTVDRAVITTNEEGFKTAKVRVVSQRIPQNGDKFSSRHGQKGVLSVLVPECDLPFTVSYRANDGTIRGGIRPDVVINPHAKPGRMTIGMVLEMLAGKAGSDMGCRMDATAFEDCVDEESTQTKLENMLFKLGYSKSGNEKCINGETGLMFESTIFVGTCYYQRLKHMVEDKYHARSRGPRHIMTRQPIDGRSRDGGLRFGEMERDCMIGYGAAMALQERMLNLSDPFIMYICKTCGGTAYKDHKKSTFHCEHCLKGAKICHVKGPYAFKLLHQELTSMNIRPRYIME